MKFLHMKYKTEPNDNRGRQDTFYGLKYFATVQDQILPKLDNPSFKNKSLYNIKGVVEYTQCLT